jgi:hypothetical protein
MDMSEEVWDREADPINLEEAKEAANIVHQDLVTSLSDLTLLEDKTSDDVQAISILEAYENNIRIILEYLETIQA